MGITQDDFNRMQARLYANKKAGGEPLSAPYEDESKLHQDIADYCRSKGWICFRGSMARKTSRTIGEPDLCIATDRGAVWFVECKAKGRKPTPEQLAIIAWLSRLGQKVAVVYSLEEFLERINAPSPERVQPP